MTRLLVLFLLAAGAFSACGSDDESADALKDFCTDWTRLNTAVVEASLDNRTEIDRLARSLDEVSYTTEVSDDSERMVGGLEEIVTLLDEQDAQRITELTPKQQEAVQPDLDAAVEARDQIEGFYGRQCDGEDARGEDGSDSSREPSQADVPYVNAMADSMRTDEELPFDGPDIDCLAAEFVDALGGAERLEEEGITPEDLGGDEGLQDLGLELGEEEADGIAASFGSCDVSLAELVLSEAGEDVPADVRECVEENLDEDVLADFFATVLVDEETGEEPPAELLEPLLTCFQS